MTAILNSLLNSLNSLLSHCGSASCPGDWYDEPVEDCQFLCDRVKVEEVESNNRNIVIREIVFAEPSV